VKINDKHIEVIVRQMLQKVEITDGGDTTLLAGEQVDREEMDEVNSKLPKGERPAVGKPVLLGITKASLQTRSFISAGLLPGDDPGAHRGSVQGKIDTLNGLKENVIVGRLIPAGTGAGMNRLRVAASSRDASLRAAQRKLAEALVARDSAPTSRGRTSAQSTRDASASPSEPAWRGGHQRHAATDADAGDYCRKAELLGLRGEEPRRRNRGIAPGTLSPFPEAGGEARQKKTPPAHHRRGSSFHLSLSRLNSERR
jgi:DNA-directed RNA polymerase subunit beta'